MNQPSNPFDIKQPKNLLLILGIIFVAFNLRPSITSVGPLISAIRADTGISNSLAGLLTTLPLLSFAILSPLAPKLAKKWGREWTILLGLLILAAGILIRSQGLIFLLFFGTLLIGLGIAICNVLLPGIVKQSYPAKVGMMTGIYTVSMAIWAGTAPGVSVPLADALHMGWKHSLGVWFVLVALAIVMWLPQLKKKNDQVMNLSSVTTENSSLWGSSLAWQVTIFMGLQSFVYFCFIAWLPEMLYSHGISITTAGWMVSILQFSGIPGNFLVPVLADRLPNQKGLALGIGAFCLAGLIGILIGGNIYILTISIICIGIATGAAISLALTLIGLRARNAEQASQLSGMAQSIGYLLAALGPIALGFMYDMFHSWTIPLILLILISCIMTLAGVGAGRNEFVLDQEKHLVQGAASVK